MSRITEEFENGVVVRQATDEATWVSNIYCERPYVSPDGRRFLYARRSAAEWEFLLCEFGQQAHPHAYLSTDYRRVVFNSDRTGIPQSYVATLPEGLLDGVI